MAMRPAWLPHWTRQSRYLLRQIKQPNLQHNAQRSACSVRIATSGMQLLVPMVARLGQYEQRQWRAEVVNEG